MKNFLLKYIIGLFVYFLIIISIVLYVNSRDKFDKTIKVNEFKLENQFGEKKSISDYKGKYVLVDFWFSGCKPCLDQMRYFPELLNEYNDLVIMSISIDKQSHTKNLLDKKTKPWAFLISDSKKWTFYNDKEKKYINTLKVKGYPSYLIFNKKGDFVGSPSLGLLGMELEMNGILGLKVSLSKYTSQYKSLLNKSIKFFIVYNIIFLIVFAFNKLYKFIRLKNIKNGK